MTLNWSDILGPGAASSDPAADLVPIGKYETRVKEAKVSPASTGKTMIEMVLVIDGGPYDEEWLWNNLVFPDSTSKPGHRRMFTRALHALGFSNEFLTTNQPSAAALAEMMVGRSVVANVAHKPFEGETRTEVKSLHPIGAADDAPPVPVIGASDDELPPPPVVTPEEPRLLDSEPVEVPAPAVEEAPPIPVVEEAAVPPVPVAADGNDNDSDTDVPPF